MRGRAGPWREYENPSVAAMLAVSPEPYAAPAPTAHWAAHCDGGPAPAAWPRAEEAVPGSRAVSVVAYEVPCLDLAGDACPSYEQLINFPRSKSKYQVLRKSPSNMPATFCLLSLSLFSVALC